MLYRFSRFPIEAQSNENLQEWNQTIAKYLISNPGQEEMHKLLPIFLQILIISIKYFQFFVLVLIPILIPIIRVVGSSDEYFKIFVVLLGKEKLKNQLKKEKKIICYI